MKSLLNMAIRSAFVTVGSVKAAGDVTFDYHLNGADWPAAYPACGNSN